jgi:hypothetical protein
VGRTMVANTLLAGSACGKRQRGRPLNSVVSHHKGEAVESFEDELRQTIHDSTKWARRNYVYAHVTFILSVLGSFLATVLAASEYHNSVVTASLAALPGLMLLINNTLRFEERTKWFWRKTRMAESYYRDLRDREHPIASSASARYSEESAKLESEWPAFGSSPGQPKKPGGDG